MKSLSDTPTGAMLLSCSAPDAIKALSALNIRQAVHAQAISSATFTGRKRDAKLMSQRRTKQDRRNYSARTYYTLIHRALRETAH